jgi:beta-mannosidase
MSHVVCLHGKQPFSLYEKIHRTFYERVWIPVIPRNETIESFTLPEDRDITSEVLNWHQRSGPGNMLIKTYLDMYYKPALNFEHFLYLNQVLQAEGVSLAMEAHRRAMPWCMGSLFWQINDCWQAPSWSSTDYFGRWKALHYYARKAYKPLLISPEVKNDSLFIYMVS